MRRLKIFTVVWGIAIIALILICNYNGKESTSFYGIAETGEIIINTEDVVTVRVVHVLPGQQIRKGQMLVELARPELTLKIEELSNRRDVLKVLKGSDLMGIQSQIDQLKARKKAIRTDIEYKINRLVVKRDNNRYIVSNLDSLDTNSYLSLNNTPKSQIDIKIEGLQKELILSLQQIQIKIDTLMETLNSSEDTLAIKLQSLEQQMAMLMQEKKKLSVYSPIDGMIGSVSYKIGEIVAPFSPILTLQPRYPLYVKGYIHENIYNQVAVNSQVKVTSLSGSPKVVDGVVVGVSSKIVEYPLRLRKRPEWQLWGREVQIKIAKNNTLLLGEKVAVESSNIDNTRLVGLLRSIIP